MSIEVKEVKSLKEDVGTMVAVKTMSVRRECPCCGYSFKDDPRYLPWIERQMKSGKTKITGKCPRCDWRGILAE